MKVKTIGKRIQLEVDQLKAGGLVIDSVPTAVEVGTIIGKGDEVTLPVKIGDKIMYKSWCVDICNIDGKRYFFIDEDTKGICAIVIE